MEALKKFITCPVRSSLIKRAGVGGLVKAETLISQWDSKTYHEFNIAINQYLMSHFNEGRQVADLCNLLSEVNGVMYQRKVINK